MAKSQNIKVEETTDIVVGQYYLVAHVRVTNNEAQKPIDAEVPIIPILHNDDKTFKVSVGDHYHLDGRFIANKSQVGRHWSVNEGYTNMIVSNKMGNQLSEIFYKRKKCLFISGGIYMPRYEKEVEAWFLSMQGKPCKGGKCPHFGTQMNLVDGKYKCPMHQLVGCPTKEVII